MRHLFTILLFAAVLFVTSRPASAAEKDPCAPRVPAGEVAQFKAMKPAVPESPDAIKKGKEIFNGKGTCYTCHGNEGKGNGSMAAALDPSPRNFTNPKFNQCKTPGEMFWAVKNGIPGSGMIAAVGTGLITEEEAWQVIFYERSLGRKEAPSSGKGGGK